MKIIRTITVLTALPAAILTGCYSPDELVRDDNANVMTLSVKGTLIQNGVEYEAEINEDEYTVTLNVPYYVSDTEEILSDLSAIKFRASMPLGAIFEPGISGIHDMSDNQAFVSTLVYEDGTRRPYTFYVRRQKSAASRLVSAELTDEDVRAVISVTDPSEENPKGKLTVLKTSGSIDAALKSVRLKASPWATIAAPGYDETTGVLDLNAITEILVFSQDGVSKSVYEVSIESPSILPPGKIGYISNMFGLQCTGASPMGFEADANYTIAAVDNYLIVSNKDDFNRMLILNRFSGRKLDDVQINTTGIDEGRQLRAISTDDDGHLVAFTYTNTREITQSSIDNGHDLAVTPTAVKAWAWLNGIQSAPTCIIDLDIKQAPISSLSPLPTEIGNMICVKGSLTSGKAVITTTEKFIGRVLAFFFDNGSFSNVSIFCPASAGKAQWFSTWNSSKAIPFGTESPLYFALTSTNHSQLIAWYTADAYFTFDVPTSYWWAGSSTYGKDTRGVDIVDFNGTSLLAVANGFLSNGVWAHRLYVANIGVQPSKSSLKDGFIFDTRESAGVPGTGYGPKGMTSTYPFEGGSGLGGNNLAKRGDVIFVNSDDGNSVQLYMMNMNAGILAYEITRYDM